MAGSGRCGLALVLAGLLVACAATQPPPGRLDDAEAEASPSLAPVPYATTLAGDVPPELARLLREVIDAAARGAPPATSRLAIRQRGEADVTQLQQALRAEGYFDATVRLAVRDPGEVPPETLVDELARLASSPEAVLVFDVTPGPRYGFGALAIDLTDNPDRWQPPQLGTLGLVAGAPALTQAVLDAEARLLADARRAGFALARAGARRVIVDHDTRLMDVTLTLEPGRRATFGEVSFPGGEGIEPDFLRGRVPFAAGDLYDPVLVDEGQKRLFETNLFSTIIPRPAYRLTAAGRLDLAYELRQRPPRTIGAELNYETELGPGVRVFWEHRNVLGAGERFRVEAAASQPEQSLKLTLRKPDFLRLRQDLLTDATLLRQRLDAYDSDSVGTGVGLEREFREGLRASLGTALRYARIDAVDEPERRYTLLSLPGKVDWDFADDRFSPTRGGTVVATLAPFTDLLASDRRFLKGRLTHTRYLLLDDTPRLVLALRGSVGALGGISRAEVPADERFYAGGGGSIRGIGYQLAGPLDDRDDPLGGRSVVEGSVELRTRFGNNFGLAAFLAEGTVDGSVFPSFEERLLFGAGPSFRYFTPIGPLRFDVGFPLNRRRRVDAPYQLYFSIGQAF